jgi:hypothetical protein
MAAQLTASQEGLSSVRKFKSRAVLNVLTPDFRVPPRSRLCVCVCVRVCVRKSIENSFNNLVHLATLHLQSFPTLGPFTSVCMYTSVPRHNSQLACRFS